MTAINNLAGHIVHDGIVVYDELLEPNLHFVVVEKYEPKYEKGNYSNSSALWLATTISTGEKHTFSNGVISLIDAGENETIKEKDDFRPLRKLKTSHGFPVWESVYGEKHYEHDGVKLKVRTVKWIVEVPKKELASFFE